LANAIENLTLQRGHGSSTSLTTSPTGLRPSSPSPLSPIGSRTNSQALAPRVASPLANVVSQETIDLQIQVDLYRNIIETTMQEKTIMIDLINDLKARVAEQDTIVQRIEQDFDAANRDNQALRAAVQQFLTNQYGTAAPPGLGQGLPNISAWAAAAGGAPVRPVSPATNPSEDGEEYLDMTLPRFNGGGH
jgi:hypothetical protein